MNEIIYLEPDEDITGVISRVKETEANAVSLVIPRGGSIAQSIVNLKLLKREIEKLGKNISLVTKDKISKNLASQVGVTVYDSANEAKHARPSAAPVDDARFPLKSAAQDAGGIKINQYSREEEEPLEAPESEMATDETEDTGDEDGPPDEEDHDQGPRVEDEEEADSPQDKAHHEREILAHAKPEAKTKESNVGEIEQMARKKISSRKKPIIILVSIALVILIVGSAVLLPSAEAKITLATRNVDVKSDVLAEKASTEAKLETMTMPAREYISEKTSEKQFVSSGKKDIGTKAGGEVTFYNDYDPLNSVVLSSGTIFTAAGKTFLLDGAVTIPAASIISLYPLKTTPGQVKGKVVAKDSGESSNIAPSKFVITAYSGVKQEKIYGQSSAALTGGTTKQVNVITQEDLDNAKNSLDVELEALAKEELTKKSGEDKLKLVMSSIVKSETEYTASKKAGDETDGFTSKLSIKLTELAFSEEGLRKIALDKIGSGLKSDEMLVNPTDNNLTYDITKVDAPAGQISLSTRFVGKVGTKIEASRIQELLAKAKYGSAESKVTSIEGVKEAQITVHPSFWPMLPFLKQRIKVSFDYQKD